MSQILYMLADMYNCGKKMLDIHLHHLLYNKIERIDELFATFSQVPIKVYLHDYFNACSNYTLMMNEKNYCGGFGLKEEFCIRCPGYSKSCKIEKRLHSFYKKYLERITFISPSEATRNIYLRFHPEYEKQIIVIPHQVFFDRYSENLDKLSSNEKIKIAFLGMPARHKGWEIWENVVNNAPKKRYEFIVFNSSDDVYKGMGKEKVCFSEKNLNAMTDLLRKRKVHIVLLWALWPETYSYTCFEAFSSNAFILTSQMSGNIADAVTRYDCGMVLNNENDLYCLFQNPSQLKNLINSYREKTPGGPFMLHENNRIVKLSQKTFETDKEVTVKARIKIVNLPLIWLLNVLYRTGKL